MKNVLILYGSYGGGHISAAKSIYNCIQTHYPTINVEIVDCIGYINKILNKLSTTAYSEIAKNAPWAWGKVYFSADKGALSKISNTSNKLMAHKLNKLLQKFKPDCIISTHPFSSNMCSYLKRKGKLTSSLATVMTDYAIHNQWLENANYTDYFFVAHEGMKQDLIRRNIPDFKIFVTGIPISERFKETFNPTEIFHSMGLKQNKRTILFFAGGQFGLGKSRTYDVFQGLIHLNLDFQVIAIAGKNERLKSSFEELVISQHKEDFVKVLSFTDKVPELMSISDFVITKPGGLTTTESIVSGLPILAISPLPGQEEQNAQFIVEHGIGVWLQKHDNIDSILLNFIQDTSQLDKMRHQAKLFSKPDSTVDICHALLD